ncbi:MAG TPA: 50S ribosomal protein L11 methyltransferase [Steroidobacteraceae bacterium]|nr:50S ribosomal protein L11 methyltransferase [Steroidobacteraceae bacterium]
MESGAFLELSFDLGDLDAETAEAACFESGASSVTFTDTRDDPVLEPAPGEFRLWPATRIQALYAGDTESAAAIRMLCAALGIPPERINVKRIADRAWEREWLKDFHAMRFGRRLWVAPHHEDIAQPDAVVVRLDPGLAFGTGTHPTTAMCLEWLEHYVTPGVRVIDYGCGSGILALAAVKLGASHAYCFDIDPQALIATRDNAAANGITDQITVCERPEQLPAGVDILVANILSGPLCALAPSFAGLVRSDGALVLAGLMSFQTPEVTQAHDAWFDMRPFARRDDWIGLSGRRRL